MVGTFLSYNGMMIRAPGGGFYDGADTDCCCEVCCCQTLVECAAQVDPICELSVSVTGIITGAGTMPPGGGEIDDCLSFQGIISLSGGGNCGGDIIQFTLTLRCPAGGTGIGDLIVEIIGSSGSCSMSVDSIDLDESSCDPFVLVVRGTLHDIFPGGCSCGDGTAFTITITL